MKRIFTWICVIACICGSVNSYAFDGKRKGFILGGGLGFGLLSNKTSILTLSRTMGEGVFLTEFKIGYAPSNSFEIYYISKGSWWSEESTTQLLGVSAIGVSKYLGDAETGLFLTGGLGLSALSQPFEDDSGTSTGFGLFGGVGYEFSKHWTIEGDLLFSKVEEGVVEFRSFGVRVSVNVLAF